MEDYPIPIIQWIQNLKHNLHFLLISCGQNSAYIHACKFAEIGTYLLKFLESLDKYASVRDSTPEENKNFRELLKLIEDMTTYVKSFHRENYLQTFLNNGINDITDEIKEFRGKFNKLCLSLNMTDSNKKPFYPNNPNQFNCNDIEDCKKLIDVLKSIIEGPDKVITDENQIQKFRHKILELETNITEKNALFINSYQNKILSNEEISQELEPFKEWEVSVPGDFYINNKAVIGRGGFSSVYLGGQISTNKIVAIKEFLRTEFTAKDLEMYKREISTYLFLQTPTKHPCLLTFVGATLKPPYCILTEYMSGQSLYTRLHNKGLKNENLSPTSKTIIAVGIAHGMEYLHSKGLIHRDLKSLNVLLDSSDFPRICDFGLSRSQGTDSEVMTKGVGTFRWMAPEVFQSNHYNEKVDVYSFGILLWEMLTEKIPFTEDADNIRAITQIDKRPPIPEDCPQNIAAFIAACWDKDPDHRPDFKSIVSAFDNGEFEFPGTDSKKVEEYIKTIIIPSDPKKLIGSLINEISISPLNNNVPNGNSSNSSISSVSSLNNSSTASVSSLSSSSANAIDKLNDVVHKMNSKDFSNSLYSALENYEDSKKTTKFLEMCIDCRDDFIQCIRPHFDSFLNYFTKNIDSSLISLISKILENSDSGFVLKFEQLKAIIQYMNYANIDPDCLKLLHLIIDNKKYSSTDDVIDVIPDLIIALQISDDSLLSILSLFEKIMNFNGFVSSIVDNNAQIYFVIALLKTPTIPLKLLNFIFANSVPTPQCVELIFPFIQEFLLLDELNVINTLSMLKSLLKLDFTFQLIEKLPKNPIADFLTYETNENIQIQALKAAFILFNNKSTFFLMFESVDLIISLLKSDNNEIKILSLLCLLQLHSNCISKLCCETVSCFLKNTFSLLSSSTPSSDDTKLIEYSLRLCGIMTETKEGAIFVNNFIDYFVSFLHKDISDDDNDLRKFTCILLASLSSYDQNIDLFNDCIDPMFDIAESSCEYSQYSLAFLNNVSSNVDFAIKVSAHMEKLINMLDSGVNEAFPIIWRVATTPESFEYWSSVNNSSINSSPECGISPMQKMVKCLLLFADCKLHEIIIDIFQSISVSKEGKKCLKNENADKYITSKLNEVADEDPLRSIYVKILSRLKNV